MFWFCLESILFGVFTERNFTYRLVRGPSAAYGGPRSFVAKAVYGAAVTQRGLPRKAAALAILAHGISGEKAPQPCISPPPRTLTSHGRWKAHPQSERVSPVCRCARESTASGRGGRLL